MSAITGDKEIFDSLANIDKKLQRAILRKAFTAAATPVLKTQRQKVQVDTGTLKKSLIKKVGAKDGKGFAVIGPQKKWFYVGGKKRRPTRYAHFAERKSHFVQVSVEANKSQVKRILAEVIKAELRKKA